MNVGVIGSGSIGPDLAYGFASALGQSGGGRVHLCDIRQDALDAGMARLRGYTSKAIERGKTTQAAADALMATLVPTQKLGDLGDAEYVLEAATEHLPVKRTILADVEGAVRPDCLVGFATSGIPRAQIAAGARHPARCFVNHPFFPAWRSRPVEVVLSGDTALGERMLATLRRLGKVPVVTADVACFAADDVFCNYISEAARIVEEGVATPAQVDAIVDAAVGGGGPFNVMDLTRGNALTVHCQELMRDAPTGTAWFEPPRLLRDKGAAPWHDRKNPGDPAHDPALAHVVTDRILAVLLARAMFVVDSRICDASEFDWMLHEALGFKKGLLDLGHEMGAERVHGLCTAYAAQHPGFVIPPSIAARRLPAFDRRPPAGA